MKTISTGELQEKLKSTNLNLIEVLDKQAFEKQHLKGAINIPLQRVVTEAKEKFGKEEQIVVYCSDKNCEASPTAQKKLEKAGFKNVFHYKGGKKAWKEAGLPMEQ